MELVAPAGNFEKLKYAYEYGADAAYIGLKRFSLRVKADNFYEDEYKAITDLKAKYPGKKLFCALNITFHNRDIDNFLKELDYFKSYPIDSFIIQDIGMVNIIKKHFLCSVSICHMLNKYVSSLKSEVSLLSLPTELEAQLIPV